MAATNVDIVIRAIDRASGTVRNVKRQIDGMRDSQGRMRDAQGRYMAGPGGRASASTRHSIMPFGLSPRLLGAGAAGLGLKGAATAAADFQSQLTAIQKKAGISADETARLGKEALALATSGELATSIDEIMSAYERGAAAGIPLDELREFARLSAMAADAFEMSAEDVGNAAAGFQVGLGVTMEQMEAYFGLINKLADSGISSESGIINFLDRAGANMKLFGLSAEQAAAYAATLGNIKMPPEVAARMMNTLTSKLLAPGSKKAHAALKGIVGNVGEFNALLKKDANAALELFLENVSKLDKFESAELLTGLLGQGFADEVLRLSNAMEEVRRNQEIARDRAGWENGLEQTYKLKLDDFWSQWQLLENAVKKLGIDLGTMAMPTLTAALEGARGIIAEIGQELETFRLTMDWSSVTEAQTAVGELMAEINKVLNIDPPKDGHIAQFFEDLKTITTDVAGAIKYISGQLTELVKFSQDPLGYVTRQKTDEELRRWGLEPMTDEERNRRLNEKKTKEEQREEEIKRLFGRPRLGDYINGTVPPPPTYVTSGDGRGGRLGKPAPEPDEARFGSSGLTPVQPRPLPPEPEPLPPGTVPLPTAKPQIDTAAYLLQIGELTSAKMEVQRPIVTQADISTAAFMSGLGQMEAAATATAQRIRATLSGLSVGAPAGGGGSYETNRRSQFAPVTP